MTTTTIAAVRRAFPYDTGHKRRGKLVVTAKLYAYVEQCPYFAVTADVLAPNGHDIGGGAMHDAILSTWPAIAPVVALHLADDDGCPMHATDNAWYWYAGAKGGLGETYHGGNGHGHTPEQCAAILSRHLRITPEETSRILALEWARADMAAYVEAQHPRWRTEAEAALALIRRLNLETHADA